jgi:polyferredoxin
MLFGVTCATLGYSCVQIGVLARIMHGLRLGVEARVRRFLTYDRGMTIAAIFVALGLVLVGTLAWHYVAEDFKLEQISYPAILGLLLLILGFQTFGFTLLLEMSQRLGSKDDHE